MVAEIIMSIRTQFLQTKGLSRIYSSGRIHVAALQEVSFSLEKGQFMGVTGSSGSGKSTLLNLLGGLDTPTSGIIETHGKRVSEMSSDELALYRRFSVGMIFQSFNLIPSLTAWENVGLPMLFAGVTKKERRNRAEFLLAEIGLAGRLNHRPGELSGGEQQRVAIARALVNNPELLLADEPTGNLDSRTSLDIIDLLGELNRSQGLSIIMVSHEESLLSRYAQVVLPLKDGRLILREANR
jgi:putative ABC transport system ATP-binding protein